MEIDNEIKSIKVKQVLEATKQVLEEVKKEEEAKQIAKEEELRVLEKQVENNAKKR